MNSPTIAIESRPTHPVFLTVIVCVGESRERTARTGGDSGAAVVLKWRQTILDPGEDRMGLGTRVESIAVLGMFIILAMGAPRASAPTTPFFGTSYTGPSPTLPSATSAFTAWLAASSGGGMTIHNFETYPTSGLPTLVTGSTQGSCPTAVTLTNFPAGGAPLFVVTSASTTTSGSATTPGGGGTWIMAFPGEYTPATNFLAATSGSKILSPGGSPLLPGLNPAAEQDGVRFMFCTGGVYAVAFDILFQSLDAVSFLSIQVYDTGGFSIWSSAGFILTGVPTCPPAYPGAISDIPCGGAPLGEVFFGICSTTPIGWIDVNEMDDDEVNPDSNVGYDTIRVRNPSGGPPTC